MSPPPTGDRGLSPPGAAGPPHGRRGSPTLYKTWSPFLSHLSPKIAPKIQKKERGEEKKIGEALSNSALVIYQ